MQLLEYVKLSLFNALALQLLVRVVNPYSRVVSRRKHIWSDKSQQLGDLKPQLSNQLVVGEVRLPLSCLEPKILGAFFLQLLSKIT